jgi:hypothetical protein
LAYTSVGKPAGVASDDQLSKPPRRTEKVACMAPLSYFVTMRIDGGGAAAAGEIANVTQTFQPEGRSFPSNSP